MGYPYQMVGSYVCMVLNLPKCHGLPVSRWKSRNFCLALELQLSVKVGLACRQSHSPCVGICILSKCMFCLQLFLWKMAKELFPESVSLKSFFLSKLSRCFLCFCCCWVRENSDNQAQSCFETGASLPASPPEPDRSGCSASAPGCCSNFRTSLALDLKTSSLLDVLGIFKPGKFSSPRLSSWQCRVFPAEEAVFSACRFKPVCLLSV